MSRGSVVVYLLEQDWALTQSIPSSACERGVMRTYSGNAERGAKLTEFLHAQGIRAELHALAGPLVNIHFAVEAGLGQLGLNGQLLTPHAGSRCRIAVITTNATLEHGGPVDYGIHKICDACQVCVKRCPPGAIPNRRQDHRGVKKAKIKPERCLPVVAQAHGCAICMKVCPIQRYGLERVTTHYLETGTVLGKGTDELEGYDWIDGRHYGPQARPRLTKEFLTPMGISIDPNRTDPPERLAEDDHEDIALA
jgi:ferredoxin